ncbi:Rad9/Ddc1 [Dipodascopsis tothii]|uniref:Rad9/Ddc1 n=1 Tax=Dipodascopsis tothii TaxID=44089 RepID=UPI0034CE2374
MARVAIVMGGAVLRDWSRVIGTLARLSDSLLLEAGSEQVLSAPKAAFGSTEFPAEFFDDYRFTGSPAPMLVRVHSRTFVSIFRRNEKDATVDKIEIVVDEIQRTTECRIVVNVHCRYGVVKTYRITYEDATALRVLDDTRGSQTFAVHAKVLKDYIEHTSPRAEEFALRFAGSQVTLSSYTEAIVLNKEILKQPLVTSIVTDTADFEHVMVDDECELVFSLRDLRAVVALGDMFNAVLTVSLGTGAAIIEFEANELQVRLTAAAAETAAAAAAANRRLGL